MGNTLFVEVYFSMFLLVNDWKNSGPIWVQNAVFSGLRACPLENQVKSYVLLKKKEKRKKEIAKT